MIILAVLLKAIVLSALSAAAFAANYTVTVIPSPSGFTNVYMVVINNHGQIGGGGNIGATQRAFIATQAGTVVIPLPPGWLSAIGGVINDSGQVAGYNPITEQAFIGTASGSIAIPFPPGSPEAIVNGVNNQGQVGGSSDRTAFVGTVSGSALIPLPSGWVGAVGYAINNLGQVTGYGFGTTSQAYIGTTSGSTAIPILPGWTFTQGVGINDLGQVAGWGNNGTTTQAFIATATQMTPIPLPIGGADAYVGTASITNLGVVIGGSSVGGWIWDATNGTRLLDNLVPQGWNGVSPLSISQNGLILAQASHNGGENQFVILTPAAAPVTPAPSTLALVLIGATFCWIYLRRRLSRAAPPV
jgi:hypothetical protein